MFMFALAGSPLVFNNQGIVAGYNLGYVGDTPTRLELLELWVLNYIINDINNDNDRNVCYLITLSFK